MYSKIPAKSNEAVPAQVLKDALLPGAGKGPLEVSKSTLIQHTQIPTNDTLLETPRQQVADTVQADLFAWDPLEGVESALTRENIKAFNEIRMKGELFAPVIPANFINTLGAINPIPEKEGMAGVKKDISKMMSRGLGAARLHVTSAYKSTSDLLPNPCPFGFQGRRETPFIPINTLGNGYSRDVSYNGLPVEWYDDHVMKDDDDEWRAPLQASTQKSMPYFTPAQQIQDVNATGYNWLY